MSCLFEASYSEGLGLGFGAGLDVFDFVSVAVVDAGFLL